MRKIKNIVAVLLAFCLLLTSFTMAFAAETASEEQETFLTVHGNGGYFPLSYVDEGGVHTNPNNVYYSMPVDTGESLTDAGVLGVAAPRQSGKNFVGWVAYHKDTAAENFGAPVDGTVLSTEEMLTYSSVPGYTDFIAQWEEESIDPNNAAWAQEIESYNVTIDGRGIAFYFDFANTLMSKYLCATASVPKTAGMSLADYGYIFGFNNSAVTSEHADRFYGWDVYTIDANQNETLLKEMVSEDELANIGVNSDMKLVARWPNGYVNAKTDWEKNVTFEVGPDTMISIETRTDGIRDGYGASAFDTLSYYIEDGFTFAEANVTSIWLSPQSPTSWLVYYGSDTEYDHEIFTNPDTLIEEELLNEVITGKVRFVANYEPIENPDAVTYNVRFDTFEHPFNFYQPGNQDYNGTNHGEVCIPILESMSPAEIGIEVSVDHDGSFLGWYVFEDGEQLMNPDEDAFDEPLILSSEAILGRQIYCNTRYLTAWEETPKSFIYLDANHGTYDLTYGETADTSYTEADCDYRSFYVEVGKSLKDTGLFSISTPEFGKPDRKFLGWIAYSTIEKTDENGDTYLEYGPVDGKHLTSEEVLVYPSTQEEITFVAQWEGDDSDYYSWINIDGVGGFFDVYWGPDSGWEHSDNVECFSVICKEDGQSITKQNDVHVTSDPVREGYTFEGWLIVPDDFGKQHLATDKLYTTEEIFELTVPHDSIRFMAKWKEIPFKEYRYGNPYSYGEETPENWFMLHMYSNGGPMTWDCESFSAPMESLYDISFGAGRDVTFLEELNDIGYGFKSLTVKKDKSTFAGWDVYTYDRMRTAYVNANDAAQSEKLFTEDGFTFYKVSVEQNPQDANGDPIYRYLLLENPVYHSKVMDTEALLDFKNDNFVAMANWSDWVDVKVEGSDEKFMLDVNTTDIAVPQAAQNKYETVEKAKDALKAAALTVPTVNKDKAETVYYEITLKIQKDDGTWVPVTPENFPKEGVKIVIPYNGLDPEKLDFIVTHLISSGDKAGEIEVLNHTVGTTGLEATVYSLSPFAVTYQNKEDAVPEATATPEPTAAPAPEKNPNDVPPTGDNNAPLFFLSMMTAAAAALFITIKKLRKA